MAVFGPIPLPMKLDEYKHVWEVRLVHKHEAPAELFLGDWKGGVRGNFSKDEKMSKAALNLLNWLISDRVTTNYDYNLAGSIA